MSRTLEVVLASASPRRTQLLEQIGVAHQVLPANVDESSGLPSEPGAQVLALAERKALAVAPIRPRALVIGADTIVFHRGEILNKPVDREHAVRLVERLAGETHLVYTGLALAGPDGAAVESSFEVTAVRFRPLDRGHAERYVATGEPLDKAGAYGIQGYGSTLVERIEGCYFNVMGLPIVRLIRMLEGRGIDYPFGPLVRA